MEFKNIDGTLKITIDNQPIPLQMKEIIKEDTFFTIKQNLNTPLYSYINIDLLLERSHDTNVDTESNTIDSVEYVEIDDVEEKSVVEAGSVLLIIRDIEHNDIIYDQQKVNFYDGIIQTTMTNMLPIGDYLLEMYYFGNKYYNPAMLTVYFSIEKREIKCVFDSEYIEGYPEETINVGATFKDTLTNLPISNCKINYIFGDNEYTTQTNDDGYTIFNITVPSVNSYRCFNTIEEEIDTNTEYINEDNQYYIDEDGNLQYITNIYNNINDDSDIEGEESTFVDDDSTTENIETEVEIVDDYYSDDEEDIEDLSSDTTAEYKVYISIDDNVYYSPEDIILYIHNKIIDTEINFTALANNNGVIHIEGSVISVDPDVKANIEYGKIIPTISNINITENYEVDQFGHFDMDILMPSPIESTKEPSNLDNYSIEIPTQTTLMSNTNTTITRNWAEKHHVDFTAKVQAGYKAVTWSMVTFIISRGNKEIYRYVTELNNDGEAFFSFNVSTLGVFKIKAIYHGMFGYLTSTSEVITYTVTEE